MMRSTWARIALVSAGLLLGAARQAHADEPARSATATPDVAELRERGNTAMRSGRPADALVAYEAVYGATHDPAMLYNMARAHQALTNYAQASALLTQFKSEASAELVEKVKVDRLLEELAGRIHTLTVRCEVPGAEVRLNDKIVGTTPIAEPLRVNAGRIAVDVRGEGFVPFSRIVELRGGAASTMEVDLVRADRSGILLVRSPQAGAAVSIDGRLVGQVPIELPLAAGEHEVLVTKEGFKASKSRIVVVTGQRKETSIDLAGKPVYTRWWFWTGVGVLAAAAGGVAGYVAMTTEKSPPTGSIAPGQASLALTY